jgi:cytidylate kinase
MKSIVGGIKMAIVTISREFGSEGNYIGTKVAETLGYHFVFKKEIGGVFRQYGVSRFEEIYQTEVDFWSRYDKIRKEMMAFLAKVIQTFAHHDNLVIVGRCSQAILAGFTDVLNVRIQAPLPIKVKRIMQENITTPDKVKDLIKREDRNRASLRQVFYQDAQWDKASAFDMVIDTGKLSPDLAVKWIVEAVKSLEEKGVYEEPTIKMIEVDPILSKVVSEVLTPPPVKY